MALLNDVRNIIKPLTNENIFNINIDYYLENVIIHNNSNINTFIINNYIYSSINNDETITNIINNIKKYIESNVKNQRNHFRMLNKKNKLSLVDFINYFDKFIKLNMTIYSTFHHIIKNIKNDKKIWYDNEIINFSIQKLVEILYEDVITKLTIQKYIKENFNTKNTELFKFNYYTINFNEYFNVYDSFVDNISISIINSIEFIKLDIDEHINKIFHFNKLSKCFMNSLQDYNYIIKNKEMKLFKDHIKFYYNDILINNNINNIVYFLKSYKDILLKLMVHIDLIVDIINYESNNFKDFILYYSTISEIFDNTDYKKNIIIGIKMNMEKYSTSENCEYLCQIINYNIMNNILLRYDWFYYNVGYYMKNKDDFLLNISQKLMNRVIYSNINKKLEFNNFLTFQKTFENDSTSAYKYKTIFTNVFRSDDYNKLCTFADKLKLLIITPDVWNVNIYGYSNNIINNNIFTAYLCNILYNYNSKTQKHLNYYLHLGYVDITIQETKLIVLPAQMLCIEQFTGFNKPINYNDFYEKIKINLNNYDNNFISKIIKSLDCILQKDGENIYMKPFNKKDNYINLIDIFHNINNTTSIIKKNIELELVHSRMDIINSVINHILKQKTEHIDDLYNKVKDNIKIFKLDQILYMDSIKNMISKDYIQYNSDTKMINKII